MSYQCEQCKESNTVGDALKNIVNIALVVGIGYMAFTFRGQLKEIVGQALDKGKRSLSGPSKRKRK